jgi:hypothetical protein
MKNASKFNRGGCFKCGDCGRKTRDTGDNGSAELCPECYERCSWENDISDNGETAENVSEVARLRAAAIAKGGVFPESAVAAPAANAMSSHQQVNFLIGVQAGRIADATERLTSIIASITRESINANQWVADNRGGVGSFASNVSMQAMEMAKVSAEIDQHKAVLKSLTETLALIG